MEAVKNDAQLHKHVVEYGLWTHVDSAARHSRGYVASNKLPIIFFTSSTLFAMRFSVVE